VGEVRTSGIGGIGIKYGNFANMETQGFEFALNTTNLKTKDFKWTSNLNLDYNTNTVTKLDNYDRIGDYVRNTGGNFVGQARRGLYSFRFAGLTKQGLPSFIDSNGDPIEENVNLQERKDVMKYIKYEGVLDAPLSGGLTNSFTYKDFSFSFGFVFRAGNVIRLDDLFSSSYTGYTSLSRDMENRWIVPGDELLTNVPTIVDRRFNRDLDAQDLNLYEMYNKSDVRVADGSFLRLKTISLGYNIPVQASNILGVHSARVSLQVQNVLLLYSDKKLNGLDPEFYRSGGVALPTPRTYSFSVNIGF
jgi:hypothetical protein